MCAEHKWKGHRNGNRAYRVGSGMNTEEVETSIKKIKWTQNVWMIENKGKGTNELISVTS